MKAPSDGSVEFRNECEQRRADLIIAPGLRSGISTKHVSTRGPCAELGAEIQTVATKAGSHQYQRAMLPLTVAVAAGAWWSRIAATDELHAAVQQPPAAEGRPLPAVQHPLTQSHQPWHR